MNLRDQVVDSQRQIDSIKAAVAGRILALPDNPRIRRVAENPRCFIISKSDLGDNWSVFHHDFREQYKWIASELEARGLDAALSLLEEIVASGKAYTRSASRNKQTFHDDVRQHLKQLLA